MQEVLKAPVKLCASRTNGYDSAHAKAPVPDGFEEQTDDFETDRILARIRGLLFRGSSVLARKKKKKTYFLLPEVVDLVVRNWDSRAS